MSVCYEPHQSTSSSPHDDTPHGLSKLTPRLSTVTPHSFIPYLHTNHPQSLTHTPTSSIKAADPPISQSKITHRSLPPSPPHKASTDEYDQNQDKSVRRRSRRVILSASVKQEVRRYATNRLGTRAYDVRWQEGVPDIWPMQRKGF
jgi:hypothetical protein